MLSFILDKIIKCYMNSILFLVTHINIRPIHLYYLSYSLFPNKVGLFEEISGLPGNCVSGIIESDLTKQILMFVTENKYKNMFFLNKKNFSSFFFKFPRKMYLTQWRSLEPPITIFAFTRPSIPILSTFNYIIIKIYQQRFRLNI